MRQDPEVLAAALDQLAKLITVLVRQERFAEVSLMGAFGGGLVLGIVRRAGGPDGGGRRLKGSRRQGDGPEVEGSAPA